MSDFWNAVSFVLISCLIWYMSRIARELEELTDKRKLHVTNVYVDTKKTVDDEMEDE